MPNRLFTLLVLFSAFLIEGIGTYVSVIGLSALFASNPVIITLAVALDIGKVVTVSFLYKYWKDISVTMRTYMITACAVLMLITSTGCFGYLSGQFQHAIAGTNQDIVMVKALEDEQSRLQARKQEIDKQIANLPADYAKARRQLMEQFAPETNRINSRLVAIDTELPKLKIESIKKNTDVGPILYVAEAFNTTPEQAVKWVILTIIFVFDPLAIALLIAGNFLIEQRRLKKEPKMEIFECTFPIDPTKARGSKIETLPMGEILPAEHLDDDELHAHLGRQTPVDSDGDGVPDVTIEDFTTPGNDLNEVAPDDPHIQTIHQINTTDRSRAAQEREVIKMRNLLPRRAALEGIDGARADVTFGDGGVARTISDYTK